MFGTIAFNEISVFNDFVNKFDLSNKKILEIGGSIPEEIIANLEVTEWVSVDPLNSNGFSSDGKYKYHSLKASNIPYPNEYFDYIFSCNAFEHISNLEETMKELKRVIKIDGIIYSHFGPIWSGPDGHHLEDVKLENEILNFWENNNLPHYSHLIHNKNELFNLLNEIYSIEDSNTIVDFVFNSTWLNRLNYEDYLRIFINSGLSIKHLETTNEVDYSYSPPKYISNTDDYYKKLKEIHPSNDFEVRDILVILKK